MGILVEHLTTRSAARVGAGIFPREAMSSFDPSGQGAEHSATRRSKPWESLSLIPSPPLTVLSSLRACRRRIAKAVSTKADGRFHTRPGVRSGHGRSDGCL